MSNYPAHWSTDEACMQRNIPALKKLVHEGETQALRAGEEAALTGEEQTRRDRHSEEQALSAWDLLSGAPTSNIARMLRHFTAVTHGSLEPGVVISWWCPEPCRKFTQGTVSDVDIYSRNSLHACELNKRGERPGVVERGGELVALSSAPVAAPSTGAAGADGRRSSQVSVGDPIPETHAVASAAPTLTEGRDKVTLSGVMAAVEQVYERRKALSLTQMENKSVIAQVPTVPYDREHAVPAASLFPGISVHGPVSDIAFLKDGGLPWCHTSVQVGGTMGLMITIMLAFIAPAFWAPDDVRRIVSSLSAVLLSLTFVFSNTIREARTTLAAA